MNTRTLLALTLLLSLLSSTFAQQSRQPQSAASSPQDDEVVIVRGAEYEQALKNGLIFGINLPIKKAGAYQLRVAVRDAMTERVGSASQYIEVPDLKKKRLTLSGIYLASNQRAQTLS